MWPVLLDVGPVQIHSYGLMVAIGFLTALVIARAWIKNAPLLFPELVDLSLWLLIGGVLGGRLLYVALNSNFFLHRPIEILMIHRGGLAFFGALLGGFIGAWVYIRRHRLNFLNVADFVIVLVPLAHVFGRVGCFLNGCCWGTYTNAPWAVTFPGTFSGVHPTQLYSAILNLLLFGLMLRIWRRRSFMGQVLVSYGFFYGLMRFFLEFYRGDSAHIYFGTLTIFQVFSIVLLIAAASGWLILRKQKVSS